MFFGLFFITFVIGSLSSMMSGMDTKANQLLNKLSVIDEFAADAKLSVELKRRLRHALKYSFEKSGYNWAE